MRKGGRHGRQLLAAERATPISGGERSPARAARLDMTVSSAAQCLTPGGEAGREIINYTGKAYRYRV